MNIKSILTFRTLISACFILLFSIVQVNAQEKGIYEIENDAATNERSHFYDLAFKLHPTIYLKNNTVKKIYGEGDMKKITLEDSKSFDILNNQDTRYKDVEIITMKSISETDLNNHLDLSNTSVFGNLKYIYIRSNFTLTPEDIISFIKVNPNVRIFYKSANQSE
ncbi:MAG: hypothetical protein ABJL44_10085 [Algibacter sp.]